MSRVEGLIVEPVESKVRKPSRVAHVYWKSDAAVARELGVTEVLSICRRVWISCAPEGEVDVVCRPTGDGGVRVVNPVANDCGNCIRILKAEVRRVVRRQK